MGLTGAIVSLFVGSVSVGSTAKDLRDYLQEKVKIEDLLAGFISERFVEIRPRLDHLCSSTPTFNKASFTDDIGLRDLPLARAEDLLGVLLPLLRRAVYAPGADNHQAELDQIYTSVLNSAIGRMWRRLASHPQVAFAVVADQNRLLITNQDEIADSISSLRSDIETIKGAIEAFQKFSSDVSREIYEAILEKAPPAEHKIDNRVYKNPFLLVRAEDFNHGYARLARLFQGSPDWESIQRRTDNVFIEGGRGTGKSMLLRRLTAQATVAAARLSNSAATFDDVPQDYFGIYVKLTRGYYDQFQSRQGLPAEIADLLAQHELNIEICDALVDALLWLSTERALPSANSRWPQIAESISALFPNAPKIRTLEELAVSTLQYEQDQITSFFRERVFGRLGNYQGSAQDTVSFMRRLAAIFRRVLFPGREVRLFLLIDEFESLTTLQQSAVNTVIKMRLPDLTLKVGVRQSGRKTSSTFTAGDPIQEPRDFSEIVLDYDVRDVAYARFLEGIAHMRLREAGYGEASITEYLGHYEPTDEVPQDAIDAELRRMWESGRRKNDDMNTEFRQKYTLTAVYRTRAAKNQRKLHFGFDQFVLLSSGIASNFIELCKYAFYFALEDGLPLQDRPRIPNGVQTDAANAVSQRLLGKIEGNVPEIGGDLQRLIVDVGSILRVRLLKHTSDPEANRLTVLDFGSVETADVVEVMEVLEGAVVWSVLHFAEPREAFRPRTTIQPRSADFIINRVYCPALGISPRARWRCPLRMADLAGLINPKTRNETHRRLILQLGSQSRNSNPGFFDGEPGADD